MGEVYHLGMMVLQAMIAQIGGSGDYLLQVVVAQVDQAEDSLILHLTNGPWFLLLAAFKQLMKSASMNGSDTC